MEEVTLSETETRYYSDLFVCCDAEKTGKIPMLKATELYRSANLSNDVIFEITSLAGIPAAALHISRAQFYSCLKLIAAYQASIPLREELLTAATVQLPLPRFSWKESPNNEIMPATSDSSAAHQTNGLNSQATFAGVERRQSATDSRRNSANAAQALQHQFDMAALRTDIICTDSDAEPNESIEIGAASSVGIVSAGDPDGGRSSREKQRRRSGSPEAWSTNSDSPTPTNSVAERPWAKETLWQGLLGDEHRQLLGTEEESSDRHSSDDDENDVNVMDLETVYQITKEQREYYYKQFKTVQHNPNGLLSGQVARVFFEKSRIPVEELRHIWQLCDVTRDGALSLSEFIAAMHLVVLRRNNIPLPAVLPACLHPNVLQYGVEAASQEPAEADLLHLHDEDEEDNTDNTVIGAGATILTNARGGVLVTGSKNVMNISTLSTNSQTSLGGTNSPPALPLAISNKQRSISNSPNSECTTPPNSIKTNVTVAVNQKLKDRSLWTTEVPPTQWTKFSESPTSNVSSPGPKPVNFDMQRTAQAVVSDPQILHPVPLRVTPVATTSAVTGSNLTTNTADVLNHDIVYESSSAIGGNSPKQMLNVTLSQGLNNSANLSNRESLQNIDLRAIQRPQAKKLPPPKNAGALPPPPQREPSLSGTTIMSAEGGDAVTTLNNKQKDIPPLPPPRPSHRHGRSSSLDLNKFKMNAPGFQHTEITTQASFDLQMCTGFADFTQFPNKNVANRSHYVATKKEDNETEQQMHSLVEPPVSLPAVPPTRLSLQTNQHVSAFEVYRKPNSLSPVAAVYQTKQETVPQPLQPPPPAPFGAAGAAAIAAPPQLPNVESYEQRVNAISEKLSHVSFNPDHSITDVLRHLREQNSILLRLCNDLSDELMTVQAHKEEMRMKLKNLTSSNAANENAGAADTMPVRPSGSSVSAPVSANVTGGSVNSNVLNTSFL